MRKIKIDPRVLEILAIYHEDEGYENEQDCECECILTEQEYKEVKKIFNNLIEFYKEERKAGLKVMGSIIELGNALFKGDCFCGECEDD